MAVTYACQGKHTEAEGLLAGVLEARTRTLGAQHDTTMSVAALLADMCSA